MFARLNRALDRAAVVITSAVSTVWCAVAFTVLALVSLPGAIASRSVVTLVSWIAQTLLQLVLLSILAVQQRLEGDRTEARDIETHDAVMAEHGETRLLLRDVQALLAALHVKVDQIPPTPSNTGDNP